MIAIHITVQLVYFVRENFINDTIILTMQNSIIDVFPSKVYWDISLMQLVRFETSCWSYSQSYEGHPV